MAPFAPYEEKLFQFTTVGISSSRFLPFSMICVDQVKNSTFKRTTGYTRQLVITRKFTVLYMLTSNITDKLCRI